MAQTSLNMTDQCTTLQFIIKPTFDCNIRCSYCYEGDSKKGLKMSLGTVEALTKKVAEYSERTGSKHIFLWHGGEPLLAGKSFYEKAISIQEKLGDNFLHHNILQTNGILLDKSFARLMTDLKIGVGVSLDGPASIHDAQRMTIRNKGTFKQAVTALCNLHDCGSKAGALSVFTRNTYNQIEEFYDFFSEVELDVKMNPLFLAGNAKDKSAEYLQVTPAEYGDALTYLFDRWVGETEKDFSFDPFAATSRTIVSGAPYACTLAGGCVNLLKVFPNGDVHACGQQPYEKYVLGNVNKDDLETILSSPHREAYRIARASLADTCGKTCEHYDICRGGCVSNAYSVRGRLTDKTFYCESLKRLYDHMRPIVNDHREAIMKSSELGNPVSTFQ